MLDLDRVDLGGPLPAADEPAKWVSTVSPGTPNALPRMTLAVLRPIPGSESRSAILPGTSPPYRSTNAWPSLISESVLLRKKPSA
jgi:hypothetical protein